MKEREWFSDGLSLSKAEPLWMRLLTLGFITGIAYNVFGNLRAFFDTQDPILLTWVMGESTLIILVLIRRPFKRIARTPGAWIAATIGTWAPLLVIAGGPALLPPLPLVLIVLPIQVFGYMIALAGKLSLGRSFGVVPADRGIKTHGLYRLMRHPIYAGYLLANLAYLLSHCSLTNGLIYLVTWLAMAYRIREEERLLMANPAYADYAARVRYRLVPGLI